MKDTLTRVHHRMDKEEREKAAKAAQKERHKSCDKYGGVSHREFAKSDTNFKKACAEADIMPTTRQASKYRRGFGSARKAKV